MKVSVLDEKTFLIKNGCTHDLSTWKRSLRMLDLCMKYVHAVQISLFKQEFLSLLRLAGECTIFICGVFCLSK